MGCGASPRIVAVDGSTNVETPALEKPVLGVTTLLENRACAGKIRTEVVQGSPVPIGAVGTDAQLPVASELARSEQAESRRKAIIVQGLADAALATIATNAVAAAGLSMTAAHVAEGMATGSGPGAAPNQIASGFASTALQSARVDSAAAAGLIEAAISSALSVAQARTRSDADMEVMIATRLSQMSSDSQAKMNAKKKSTGVPRSSITSRSTTTSTHSKASLSEIIGSMFRGVDF